MDTWGNYKSSLGYESGNGKVDNYGVDHSKFSLRDEIAYQMARSDREEQLIKDFNNQGITQNYPQYGTNFWEKNAENNYGFGFSDISKGIENIKKPLKNNGSNFQNNNSQTHIVNSSNSTFGQSTNTLQNNQNANNFSNSISFGNNSSINSDLPLSYNNSLSAKQRENAMKNGEKLYLRIADNPEENGEWKWWCDMDKGSEVVNKYDSTIEKYANKYNVDTDLIKAIMFSENACGHYFGGNELMDYLGLSKSQTPMNIRGDIWSNFQGKHYNTYDPEQNIELSTRLIKQIYDSLENPTPAKVTTIWNSAGKNKMSSFGYRGEKAYETKPWLKENR